MYTFFCKVLVLLSVFVIFGGAFAVINSQSSESFITSEYPTETRFIDANDLIVNGVSDILLQDIQIRD